MFNIYVGNLSFDATEDDVRSIFEEHGEVLKVNLITDRETGRRRLATPRPLYPRYRTRFRRGADGEF